MPDVKIRVAIYARISEDATGEAAGVARQLDDARALAAMRGWEVVGEFTDNDISALSGKVRPGYVALMRAVEAGAIEQVVTWQTSRLWRNRAERARDIDSLARARVGIVAVKGPSLDLSTAYGRGMAGLLGEFDTMESEVKGERVAAAAAQRAREGRPNGSLGYGWRKDESGLYIVHEPEADIVREVVRRLGDRESLRGVTDDLNSRGAPAPNSAMWGKTSVKKLAVRPSNVALRVHHRGRPTEQLLPGAWPALVSRDEWERVVSVMTEPTRRSNGGVRPGARRHLLTWGVAECGVCGGRMRVGLKGNQRYGRKTLLYICEAKGCVGRNQEAVDELVRGVVLERLSRPDALDWLAGDEDAAKRADARARELRQRLDEAADRYAEGKITTGQLERITARLLPDIEAAEEERRRHVGSRDVDMLAALAGPEAATRWDVMPVAQQRAIVEVLRLRVIIERVNRRGPGFDPDSVRIEWWGGLR